MICEIVELGDPILRQVTSKVNNVEDPKIQQLITNLMDTMLASGGVGIAAPQIGVAQSVCIVASRPNERYPHAPLMEPTVMINPQIEWASDENEKDWEGCLSVPGLRALVPRSKVIKINYVDGKSGKVIHAEFKDFVARVCLHEFDHLHGFMFLDRVVDPKDYVTTKEYQKIISARLKQ